MQNLPSFILKMQNLPSFILKMQNLPSFILKMQNLPSFILKMQNLPSFILKMPVLIPCIRIIIMIIIIIGVAFTYTLLQLALWWIFHTMFIFWKIVFPFHARSFQSSHNMTLIYAACIAAGLVIPLVPVIAHMASFVKEVESDPVLQAMNVTAVSGGFGYRIFQFPPILCSGTNSGILYYSNAIPINIIMMVGIAQLIIIVWRIHKVIYSGGGGGGGLGDMTVSSPQSSCFLTCAIEHSE